MRTETRFFEVRDRGTFIPVMATRAIGSPLDLSDRCRQQDWLFWRGAYSCIIVLTHLHTGRSESDAFQWSNDGTRTMHVIHAALNESWDTYESGQVIDVEFVLGETATPKESERGQ